MEPVPGAHFHGFMETFLVLYLSTDQVLLDLNFSRYYAMCVFKFLVKHMMTS